MSESLPRWDLTPVYPSVTSKAFFDDIEKLRKMFASFCELLKSKDPDLATIVDSYNEISDLAESCGTFAYCNFTVNTTDKDSVNALNKVEELSMDDAVADTMLKAFVAANKEKVDAFVAKNPDYRFIFNEIAQKAQHQMSNEMEALAADLQRNGSESYSRLQQAVSSSACAELDGEKKTVIQLRALATDKDRETRRKAYEAELKVWKEHEVSFAFALNAIKGTCLSLEKRRNWSDPLERSATSARITMKTLDALIETLEKNLPMFRKYLKTKAKLLGIEKCAFYDLFAPVGTSHKTWTYEEALKFVARQYGSFNPAMGEFAENAYKSRWIDPEPRNGKTGGAYDTYIPAIKESRVFANFDGTYDGVSTFAHELGHAWHDHVVSVKPAMLRNYTMTLAETASIFSEFIVFKGAVEEASPEEKISLIESFVQGACQVCVDILCRFYFERELFARRKNGEVMQDELCEIMIDCQKKTYGDGLDENALHPWMWAVKGHYYSAGFSFYNYPYAFGQLFGLGLYSRSKKDADQSVPFYKKYNQLLSLTGQLPASDVAATVGIDLEDPSFWQEGMDIIATYADELEALANK